MKELENIIKENKELISVMIIGEASFMPSLIIKFIDGTKSMVTVGNSISNIEGIIDRELNTYRIKQIPYQRRLKLNKILNVIW